MFQPGSAGESPARLSPLVEAAHHVLVRLGAVPRVHVLHKDNERQMNELQRCRQRKEMCEGQSGAATMVMV